MKWQDQLKGDPVPWLLEPDQPGMRYLALRDLMELPHDDPELVRAQELAHTAGPVATILAEMNPVGYWVEPGPGYNPKYRSAVWSLILLAQLGASLVRKVKGAMVYPAVILSVAVGAIAILLIFVIPTFQSMFASVNMELPLPTRVVIGASNFLTNWWWMIILAAVGIFFAVRQYYATPAGRRQIDGALLNAPVLGDLLRKSAVSRFTRTLGTLISSGVSILDGLEITAKTAGNMVIHDAVMKSRQSIAGGETIAGPLAESKVFPPMVISMVSVGEQTGAWTRCSPRSPTSTLDRGKSLFWGQPNEADQRYYHLDFAPDKKKVATNTAGA